MVEETPSGPDIVYPGMPVSVEEGVKTRIGQGLVQDMDSVMASRCGILNKERDGKTKSLWVQNSQVTVTALTSDIYVHSGHTDNGTALAQHILLHL